MTSDLPSLWTHEPHKHLEFKPGLRVADLASKRAELAAHGIDIGAEPHEEHGFLLSLFTGPDGAKASLSGPAPKPQT